ncbi:MAG: hypothetical protein HQ528_10395 [Candidatus Marinimicrobia bacterium]|nr:hypothetical protein [Candidatus Neomarinimicrobiota bacterium]
MNKLQNWVQSLRQPYRWLFSFGLFIFIIIIINSVQKYFDPEVMLISNVMIFTGVVFATFISVRYFQTDRGKSIFFLSGGGLLGIGVVVSLIVVPLVQHDLLLTIYSGILALVAIVLGIVYRKRVRKG